MFYAGDGISFLDLRFENDVKQYGTQASTDRNREDIAFENDVKQYGTQADIERCSNIRLFENDVKQYGTQACHMPVSV